MQIPRHGAALALALAAAAGAALAQGGVMKLGDVTESAIVDALAPPAAATEGASGPRSRGFAPALRPKKPASAAVLITFVTDSAELTPESKATLDVIGHAMSGGRLAKLAFEVEGHADPRGSDEHNAGLSRERAESVVAYLVQEHGIARERLDPVGKGSAEPLNRERPDAPENRRVTFVTRTN